MANVFLKIDWKPLGERYEKAKNIIQMEMIRNYSLKWPMIRNPWEKDEGDRVIGVHHTQQLNSRFLQDTCA